MEISKKDLLKETGISYGQLYRWKREGLIPEEWFEKRSSFTGQETFFPKEAILKRVEMIQQLKDHYSLEEMAKMLTPTVSNRMFQEDDMETFKELDTSVIAIWMDIFEKDEFRFEEIISMIAISKCMEEYPCSEEQLRCMLLHMKHAFLQMQQLHHILCLYTWNEELVFVLLEEGSVLLLDDRFASKKEIHLLELSNTIKLKYQHSFQFDVIG